MYIVKKGFPSEILEAMRTTKNIILNALSNLKEERKNTKFNSCEYWDGVEEGYDKILHEINKFIEINEEK